MDRPVVPAVDSQWLPARPDDHLLVPRTIYWHDAEPMPFYPPSAILGPTANGFPHTTIEYERFDHGDGGVVPLHPGGNLIDTRRMNGDCRMMSLVPGESPGRRRCKAFSLVSSDLSNLSGRTVRALFWGDSLIDHSGNAAFFKQVCEQAGAKVELVGTLLNREYDKTVAPAPGEGRAGKRFTDYTCERLEALPPVPVEDYAALYLGGTVEYRRGHNPFGRLARAGDDGADCFADPDGRSWTFDFGHYMARNGYAEPLHHVFINLGSNDIGNGAMPKPLVSALSSADRILRSIRAYSAEIHVSFILNGLPVGEASATKADRAKWNDRYSPFIRAMLQFQRDHGEDGRLHIVPGHLIFDPVAGWDFVTIGTDPQTGIVDAGLSESGYIHFRRANSRVLAKYQASIAAAFPPGG